MRGGTGARRWAKDQCIGPFSPTKHAGLFITPPVTRGSWNKSTPIFLVSLKQKSLTRALTGCSRGNLQVAAVQGPRHTTGESWEDPETQVRRELRPLVRVGQSKVGRVRKRNQTGAEERARRDGTGDIFHQRVLLPHLSHVPCPLSPPLCFTASSFL